MGPKAARSYNEINNVFWPNHAFDQGLKFLTSVSFDGTNYQWEQKHIFVQMSLVTDSSFHWCTVH